MSGEVNRGILAAANSPLRAVATSVIGGLTLALLIWVAALLSHMSYAMPAIERRVAIIEARDSAVVEQAAATREALAVLRTQIGGVQDEMRMLRTAIMQQRQQAVP